MARGEGCGCVRTFLTSCLRKHSGLRKSATPDLPVLPANTRAAERASASGKGTPRWGNSVNPSKSGLLAARARAAPVRWIDFCGPTPETSRTTETRHGRAYRRDLRLRLVLRLAAAIRGPSSWPTARRVARRGPWWRRRLYRCDREDQRGWGDSVLASPSKSNQRRSGSRQRACFFSFLFFFFCFSFLFSFFAFPFFFVLLLFSFFFFFFFFFLGL